MKPKLITLALLGCYAPVPRGPIWLNIERAPTAITKAVVFKKKKR
jgi:hypothetical protein